MKNKTEINENEKTIKNKNIAILAMLMAVLLLCSLSTTSAANQTINDTSTGGIAQGITDTGTGDTLFLQEGTYNKTSDREIIINKNITIQGNGSTDKVIIDAQGLGRIFFISNGHSQLILINITLINGNTSASSQGAGAGTFEGGAIYQRFDNNYLTLIDCIFINNFASIGGGAVATTGGNITGCKFINNTAGGERGALKESASSPFCISNSIFEGNSIVVPPNATRNNIGGAITFWSNSGDINYLINCTFIDNSSGLGGAILVAGTKTFIYDCTFIGNDASGGGGAIYSGNAVDRVLFINNSTFKDNKAINGGGAILITHNVTITNCTFNDNHANGNGGAISNQGNTVLLGNIMAGNSAGLGQMIFNNGTMGILNLTFISNSTLVTKIGSIVTLYANLTDDMGNTVTGQNISFYLNGVLYENVEVIEGLAEVNFTATSLGDIPVSGEYDGNGDFAILINNGLLIVNKINVSTTIVIPENVTIGKEINITGVLTDDNSNSVGNVTLNVTIGNDTFTVVTNPDGSWSLPYTPDTLGDLDITVSLNDHEMYNDFNNSANFTVNKVNVGSTIVVPENVSIGREINITGVATDDEGTPLANIDLTVTVDGKTYTVKTDSNGQWSLPYLPTHTGNVEVSASWAGNDTHNGFTNSTNFNVAKRNIIVTITVTENPDGSVTVIANATYEEDGSPATGYPVDFFLDGKIIGTGVTDSNGIATLTIPANKISDGPHTISVVVIGDDTTNDATTSIEFTKTTKDNPTNKTNNKPTTTTAAMKNTGIPIIAIILLLLTSIGLIVVKKEN